MAVLRGNQVLSGSWAELWVNEQRVAEFNKIDAKITFNREDVQIGMNVDSKIVGCKGEGTLSLNKVFTRFADAVDAAQGSQDVRYRIRCSIKDPDSDGIEDWTISNVWFTEMPLASREVGKKAMTEIPFGFTPGSLKRASSIAPKEYETVEK